MCRYLAGEVIVIRYQHIAGCQSLYSYILSGGWHVKCLPGTNSALISNSWVSGIYIECYILYFIFHIMIIMVSYIYVYIYIYIYIYIYHPAK